MPDIVSKTGILKEDVLIFHVSALLDACRE